MANEALIGQLFNFLLEEISRVSLRANECFVWIETLDCSGVTQFRNPLVPRQKHLFDQYGFDFFPFFVLHEH